MLWYKSLQILLSFHSQRIDESAPDNCQTMLTSEKINQMCTETSFVVAVRWVMGPCFSDLKKWLKTPVSSPLSTKFDHKKLL